jgi:riboflavin biosynthesis pyrimidine reductase
MIEVREVARIQLPTISGEFDTRAFECASGHVYLAMIKGEIGDGHAVLTRVHSECLTGDALGSLRCDCGAQLDPGLRALAAEGRGVLVYATGHEGRGIGLIGGPRVITSLVAANMADRAVISISPEVRGQDRGGIGRLGNEVTPYGVPSEPSAGTRR